jgi:hypothetical protein
MLLTCTIWYNDQLHTFFSSFSKSFPQDCSLFLYMILLNADLGILKGRLNTQRQAVFEEKADYVVILPLL